MRVVLAEDSVLLREGLVRLLHDEGLRAALRARELVGSTAVLVLSQYVEVSYAADVLSAGGGVGCLLKDRVTRLDELAEALDTPGRTALAAYTAAVGPVTAEEVPLRSLGLLPPRDDHTRVGDLSVGQRRHLALAVAVATAPGALVVTSHDRWPRAHWTGPTPAHVPPS